MGGGERGSGEEDALLDVVAGEHWEVGDSKLELADGGWSVGNHGAPRDDGDRCRRR